MFFSRLAKHAVRQSALKRFPVDFCGVARPLSVGTFPPPRLFDYETVTKNLTVADAIDAVEEAFAALAKGKVGEF